MFNAADSDRYNWFAKSRLIHSPWNDLDSEQQNVFSILGDSASGRSFYINKYNNSCDGDIGWLMASSGKLCSFESRHSETVFMYSKLNTSVNWNDYGKKCNTLYSHLRALTGNSLLSFVTHTCFQQHDLSRIILVLSRYRHPPDTTRSTVQRIDIDIDITKSKRLAKYVL